MRKALKVTAAFLVLGLFLGTAEAARADYGAIAYSKSTGKYGYSYGWSTRAEAEADALSHVPASDRKIVVWAKNGYCALATGDVRGAHGWGWGTSKAIAQANALRNARKHTTGAHLVVTVYSGD